MIYPPGLLVHLVAAGRWPGTAEEATRQNLSPLVSPERVAQLAPGETMIYLFAPPFHTVRERATSGECEFWRGPEAAPSEIDFDLAMDIGDFGLGSDAPILLDYRACIDRPRVIRLRWSPHGAKNHWVMMAPDFETFARVLGLYVTA